MLLTIACLIAIGAIIHKLTNRNLKRSPMTQKRARELGMRR